MVRRWAWVGIVLFVVADAVLIMVALRHTRDGADAAPPYAPVVASTSAPETSITPPPTTPATSSSPPEAATSVSVTTTATTTTATSSASTTTSTSAAEAPDLAATVLLDMASDGSAIRATRGACTSGGGGAAEAVVQVSGDAGDTWTTVDSAATAVERVAASRGGKSWFVATDADCALVEHDSAGGGKDWSTSSPDGAWTLPVDVAATSILVSAGLCGGPGTCVVAGGHVGFAGSHGR